MKKKIIDLIFEDVFAIYYVRLNNSCRTLFSKNKNNLTENESFEEENIRIETSTLYYVDKDKRYQIKIISNQDSEWADQYTSKINFVIEMDLAILLIEAETIMLDGERFTGLIGN